MKFLFFFFCHGTLYVSFCSQLANNSGALLTISLVEHEIPLGLESHTHTHGRRAVRLHPRLTLGRADCSAFFFPSNSWHGGRLRLALKKFCRLVSWQRASVKSTPQGHKPAPLALSGSCGCAHPLTAPREQQQAALGGPFYPFYPVLSLPGHCL